MSPLDRMRTVATTPVARVAVTLALLGVVVVGAIRPSQVGRTAAAPTETPAAGGPGVPLPWVVAAAAGVVAVLLLAGVVRHRRRRRDDEPRAVPIMLPPTVWERVVAVGVVLLVFGVLGVLGWQAMRLTGPFLSPTLPRAAPGVTAPRGVSPAAGSGVNTAVFLVAGAAAALALLVAIGVVAWVRHSRTVQPVRSTGAGTGLAEAAAAGLAALRRQAGDTDDDRTAILACYAAMEQHLACRGMARAAADTPSEHLRRAVDAGVVRADAATALVTLFHRARFSDHRIRAADRRAAERALAEMTSDTTSGREVVR